MPNGRRRGDPQTPAPPPPGVGAAPTSQLEPAGERGPAGGLGTAGRRGPAAGPDPSGSPVPPGDLGPARPPDAPAGTGVPGGALRQRAADLPEQPGVYLFKDAQGQVLYVGKARSLRQRVRSYFQSSRHLPARIQRMVERAAALEFIVTRNEVEALVLENTLIKRYRPRYNVRLRDDKTYPYLKVHVHEDWPRVSIARQVQDDGARYFGPYTHSASLQEALRLIRRVFPYRSCSDHRLRRGGRPCLHYYIGRCLAPCAALCDRDRYDAMIRDLIAFLEGRSREVLERVEAEMQSAAARWEFERAAELRDQLRALHQVLEQQQVASPRRAEEDAIGIARQGDRAHAQVFFVREGRIIGREQLSMTGVDGLDDGELLAAFLTQYYGRATFVPREILLPAELPPGEAEVIGRWLSQRRGVQVRLHRPQRGTKRRWVELAEHNARLLLAQAETDDQVRQDRARRALEELARYLDLDEPPRRIECYDISNFQGAQPVGSMVVMIRGEPAKAEYRRFRIRTVEAPNDFASMQEVLYRRLRRGLEAQGVPVEGDVPSTAGAGEGDLPASVDPAGETPAAPPPAPGQAGAGEAGAGQAGADRAGAGLSGTAVGGAGRTPAGDPGAAELRGFADLPDLILIDGGKGQLSAAQEVLDRLGLVDIPVFALAKRFELVYAPDRPDPIVIPRDSPALHLLQRIRDEAHRFALSYHRQLRQRAGLHSVLEELPGIGPRRRKALLEAFGSLEAIARASEDELAAVPGMNRAAARTVYRAFHRLPTPDTGPPGGDAGETATGGGGDPA
ncbi:excinuclease ABC subunit UvrC [Thermaerobacter subterraneus]|uniref:UvrABC system protein C n=1 Tax=Thermaerobacter subterraneus DSM 13965 TaxID=867903 RepID=K6Q0J2_9FIRM|nr:excinuclease ABC subunit UvrC [Thermaerobacter subterraneus]EKP94618.1 Excinuclease ABC subunit C [Thermaerobacter subterraneus DSM 13965]